MNNSQVNSKGDANMSYEDMRLNQNFVLGLIGGLIAGIIGAGIWTVVTVLTEKQYGLIAIGIGILVGGGVRLFGKGIETRFGVMAAIIAFIACMCGNVISIIVLVAKYEGIPVMQILQNLDLGLIKELFLESLKGSALLFYALAVYEAFKIGVIGVKAVSESSEV